jgi:hypothetical protein
MANGKKETHNEYSKKKREGIHAKKELLDLPFSWASTLLLGVVSEDGTLV